MYCGKCGSQIPDDAVFCPVCGGKNAEAGTQPQPASGQNPAGWNLNVQSDTAHQQLPQQGQAYVPPPVYQQPAPGGNYSPVQTPDKKKNKTVLIIVISVIAVLLIVGIIATAALVRRLRDDDDQDKETTRRTRQTTTEAVIGSVETSESDITEETTVDETEATTVETETTVETTIEETEPTDTSPSQDVVPGLVPDYIWEYADFEAELVDYAGHYQGNITTAHNGLDQIYIFQGEDRSENVDKVLEAAAYTYFIDMFIEGQMLEGYSEHPLSSEDGSFIYFDPFEIQAGGYFEEYSNDSFDGTDVTMYGYVQTAFYQLPGGPPSFYLLNYEEYNHNGQSAYFEVRIDVSLVE